MKRRKGFTLIELLAVIVILAVIALIAVPLIMNTIEEARDGSLKNTGRNLIHVAELEYATQYTENPSVIPSIDFNTLEYKGDKVDAIAGSFDANGKASIAIYKESKCVYKRFTDEDVILDKTLSQEDCLAMVGGNVEKTGAEMLIEKANDASITNYEDGNKGEMYTFSHPATEQTGALTDYRYIGNTPNNYITFNNETWRIIGVFESRIKIIKDESIGELAWDSANTNDWTTASLQQTLNNGTGSSELSEEASNQIDTVTWYLGGTSYNSSTHFGTGSDIYTWERGTTVYSGRPTSWSGKVGLMYPSDYVYTYAYGVDDTCYKDGYNCYTGTPSSGWLYNNDDRWTLSPTSRYSNRVFVVYSMGYVDYYSVPNTFWVRPVVHLRSDIVLSGSGTVADPYKIL